MGCWEGTCQVSGLSISRNTPVVVFPIVFMYGKWTPCWIPIHGKYNEGGSITDIESNFMTDRIVNDVLTNAKYSDNHDEVIDDDNIVPIPPNDCNFWIGKQIKYSIDNGKIPTTIEELLNVLEREGCRGDVISVKGGYKHEWCRLSLCMVRKDVYDWMLSQYEIEYDANNWNGKDWALLRDYCNNDINPDTELDILTNFELSKAITKSHEFGEGEYALIHPWNLTNPHKLSLDDRKLWFKLYSEFYRFDVMFQRMRKSWGLSAQAGSQDDNAEITQLFSKFMVDVCETEIHNYDED